MGTKKLATSSTGARKRVTRATGRRVQSFVDRARQPGEELRPSPTPPKFEIARVACNVEDDGLARVGPLPSSAVAVQATVGPFAATASLPESTAVSPVTLQLRSKDDSESAPREHSTYSAYELAQAR